MLETEQSREAFAGCGEVDNLGALGKCYARNGGIKAGTRLAA